MDDQPWRTKWLLKEQRTEHYREYLERKYKQEEVSL